MLATPGMLPGVPPTLQVTFGQPEGMQVNWDVAAVGQYDSVPLVVPGRQLTLQEETVQRTIGPGGVLE